jgi:hypothetical protein
VNAASRTTGSRGATERSERGQRDLSRGGERLQRPRRDGAVLQPSDRPDTSHHAGSGRSPGPRRPGLRRSARRRRDTRWPRRARSFRSRHACSFWRHQTVWPPLAASRSCAPGRPRFACGHPRTFTLVGLRCLATHRWLLNAPPWW